MKTLLRITLIMGFCVLIGLVVREGVQSIFKLLSRAGWLLVLLVPLHVLPLILDVLGWRELLIGRGRVRWLFVIACIREAINRLLPVANVGGEIVGVRLLARLGTDSAAAASSVIVETLITLVSQYLFVVCGVMCLLQLTQSMHLGAGIFMGLFAVLPILALLVAILHQGSVFRRLELLARRLFGSPSQSQNSMWQGDRVDAAIRELLLAYGRCGRALCWQFCGLVAGCIETWLALAWLGHPIGFAAALALESLTQAARHFIFIVPAGLGVQEAGLIGVGHLVGLDTDTAIALSLAKRTREILFGLPSLAAWYWLEGRSRLTTKRSLDIPEGI